MQVNSDIFRYRYLIVFTLIVISFLFTYGSIQAINDSKYNVGVKQDELSGEEYSTAGIYNYKSNNPYGSYFIGFNQITDRGVRNSDWLYISDVLTNFTMYNQKSYNSKVSFVKNSFLRGDKGSSSFDSYQFDFGIDEGNIYTMKVQSSWAQEIIRISIVDTNDKELFFKEFKVY